MWLISWCPSWSGETFIITPESVALKSSASSPSGWAQFLRPVGTDHSVCALTDGEQHTNNSLSTSARTAQPLSPEANPFVQGETLRDGSKGHRNDLEWQSRELAKQEFDYKSVRDPRRADFGCSPNNPRAAPVPVTSLMNSELYSFQSRWAFHQFIWIIRTYCQE